MLQDIVQLLVTPFLKLGVDGHLAVLAAGPTMMMTVRVVAVRTVRVMFGLGLAVFAFVFVTLTLFFLVLVGGRGGKLVVLHLELLQLCGQVDSREGVLVTMVAVDGMQLGALCFHVKVRVGHCVVLYAQGCIW